MTRAAAPAMGALRAHGARWRLSGFDPARELKRCAELGIAVLRRGVEPYPPLLAEIPDPPRILYMKGRLPSNSAAIAIVGSRRPTAYGRRMARMLARELALAGVPVVSGLARGIDSEAHRAALEAGGPTWAVLGSGLDRVYPPENEGLARGIVRSGGAVLGEVPLGGAPAARNFPLRNRIISGLSLGVIVVEGDVKSGTLITAAEAARQGREVFAVPGPADSALSEGPHELLRQGARIARRAGDIFDELPALRKGAGKCGSPEADGEVPSGTNNLERKILSLLWSESKTLEELACETGWELPLLVEVLTELERRGILSPQPGQSYGRN